MPRPGLVIGIEWLAFAASWVLAASWSSKVEQRPRVTREILYRAVLLAGAIILAVPAHGYIGPLRLWRVTRDQAWGCAAIIALGFAFAWWARIHLGALWSSNVTSKVNHQVVDTGPYGMVTLGIWLKARLEENWLTGELPGDAYQRYRSRVPMLPPFAFRHQDESPE